MADSGSLGDIMDCDSFHAVDPSGVTVNMPRSFIKAEISFRMIP